MLEVSCNIISFYPFGLSPSHCGWIPCRLRVISTRNVGVSWLLRPCAARHVVSYGLPYGVDVFSHLVNLLIVAPSTFASTLSEGAKVNFLTLSIPLQQMGGFL